MKEIWKDIEGYAGCYQIFNFNLIKSLSRKGRPTEKILKQIKDGKYYVVSLSKNNIVKKYTVHRLLAIAFIPNPENYPQVLHRNDIGTDNRLENLYWGNIDQNGADASRNCCFSNTVKGEAHYAAKLTKRDIIKIRKMWATNQFLKSEIGRRFNVCGQYIGKILKKETWKHI